MGNYTVDYKLVLWGSIDVEAASEDDAEERIYTLPEPELLEYAGLGCVTDIEVVGTVCNDSPLEQLANQAE